MIDNLPKFALSVRQPWAWAIIYAGKDVENRDWRKPNPGLTFRGRVAIHASSGMTRDEYDAIMPRSAPSIPAPHLLIRGAIIGHVDVVDIVRDPGRETVTSPWFSGPVGILMRDPVAIEPIPCRGSLGFFEWRNHRTECVSPPAKWMLPVDSVVARPEAIVYDLFNAKLN